ncbi:DUF5667 domain-containing protein [Nocardioides sp. CN2-186]|uniref:DUF5667 domain-containing protein n=1 Tax=Nocardioides tweenelious TaxID=3156607 RepID=UPI0032B50864
MTWGLTAQRRADQFNAMVEDSSAVARGDARDAELLELVGALRTVPEINARPEFVTDLRALLMAEAQTALVPADVSKLRLPPRKTTRERRLAAVVGGIAIVGASTSVALAAQSAVPGESLYPIKRVIESAHTGLSVGDAHKGSTMLGNASSRLDEVDALSQDPGFGDDVRIASTLGTFASQTTTAADLLFADYADHGNEDSIVELRDFVASSLDQLEALEPTIPYAARDDLIRAAAVLGQINAEAVQRCPSCGGTPVGSFPTTLLSSPAIVVPATPVTSQVAATTKKHDGAKKHGHQHGHQHGDKGGSSELPDVGQGTPPGSVLSPPDLLPDTSGTDGGSNPLQTLTDGLSGRGSDPTSTPSVPSVGDVVDGVTKLLHGVVDPITGETIEK